MSICRLSVILCYGVMSSLLILSDNIQWAIASTCVWRIFNACHLHIPILLLTLRLLPSVCLLQGQRCVTLCDEMIWALTPFLSRSSSSHFSNIHVKSIPILPQRGGGIANPFPFCSHHMYTSPGPRGKSVTEMSLKIAVTRYAVLELQGGTQTPLTPRL